MCVTTGEYCLKRSCSWINIWDINFFFVYRYLGDNNFSFLLDLDNLYESSANKYTVKDERIIKNGFNVDIVFNGKLYFILII